MPRATLVAARMARRSMSPALRFRHAEGRRSCPRQFERRVMPAQPRVELARIEEESPAAAQIRQAPLVDQVVERRRGGEAQIRHRFLRVQVRADRRINFHDAATSVVLRRRRADRFAVGASWIDSRNFSILWRVRSCGRASGLRISCRSVLGCTRKPARRIAFASARNDRSWSSRSWLSAWTAFSMIAYRFDPFFGGRETMPIEVSHLVLIRALGPELVAVPLPLA